MTSKAIAEGAPPPARTPPGTTWRAALWAIWAVFLVAGLVGVTQRFTEGHLPAGYGSYVPWGLWVALYFHGVGIAGGAFFIGALGYVMGWPALRRPEVLRVVLVLSAAAILPAFIGIWLDIGRLERAYRIFTSPAFTSMMAFNAWMYLIHLVVLAVAWWLSYRPGSGWLKPVLALGILFSVAFPSQSGAFFGVVGARPFWHSALLPVLFLTSAITAGAAMLMVVLYFLKRTSGTGTLSLEAEELDRQLGQLRIWTIAGLALYYVFEFAEFSIALWNPQSAAPAIELILFGSYWWVFWIVHLLFGGLVPFALLALRGVPVWTLGAALVAVTFPATRLNVLIPGQAVGEIRGLQEAFQHERLTYIYNATAMEYLVGLFLVAAGMAIFWLGLRISRSVARRMQAPSSGKRGEAGHVG